MARSSLYRGLVRMLHRPAAAERRARAPRELASPRRLQLEPLEDRRLLSAAPQVPHLVDDVNRYGGNSNPSPMAMVGGIAYFAAGDASHGAELWRSDGTAAGTYLVKDINPNSASSSPAWLVDVNGTLFFTADDGVNGVSLWKSDGTTAGTARVPDIDGVPGWSNTFPEQLTSANGLLFYSRANIGSHGGTLWRSDGTAAGSFELTAELPAGRLGVGADDLVLGNGAVYSCWSDGELAMLFKSDGTLDGTSVLFTNLAVGGSNGIRELTYGGNTGGGFLYFAKRNYEGEWQLATFMEGNSGPTYVTNADGGINPENLTLANAWLYFTAEDGSGRELWASNGTTAGRVLDINPGASDSDPHDLTAVGTSLYFVANDGVHGDELWKSDGASAANTVMIKDIAPGLAASNISGLTNVNGTLFFMADDGVHGPELWKTNGTAATTVMVRDLAAGAAGSSPGQMLNANGALFFAASDLLHGRELWKSNGTAAGTMMVRDINTSTAPADPQHTVAVNGTIFFAADNGADGRELWITDGTQAGTSMVDIYSGIAAGLGNSSDPQWLTRVGSTLFFTADDGVHGRELWKSNGTAGGTVLVRDIIAGSVGTTITDLVAVNNTLFFIADDGVHGAELWKSDGTADGTSLVRDIETTAGQGAGLHGLTGVGAYLFFATGDTTSRPGYELWRSDGTTAGTVVVRAGIDATFDNASAADVDGTFYFTADDGTHGNELWKSDGTSGGTTLVSDIVAGSDGSSPYNLTNVGGILFFTVTSPGQGRQLWKHDEVANETVMVEDLGLGAPAGTIGNLTNLDGTLYFTADNGVYGAELWVSDGTGLGTEMLKDIRAGSEGSNPSSLIAVDGRLFFTADDGSGGVELWTSNGTLQGTVRVVDLFAGANGSNPGALAAAGDSLYFTADDGNLGRELWVVSTAGTAPSIGSLTATPDPVPYGENITLTANGILSPSGTIVQVEFYRDSDGDGKLDVDVDELLVSGAGGAATWSWTGPTTDFDSGVNRFFARAQDNLGAWSNPAIHVCEIEGNGAILPLVTVNSLVTNNNRPTLTGTVDTAATGVTIAGIQVVVGGQTLTATVTGTTWSVKVPQALAGGVYNVQATATDSAGETAADSSLNELLVDLTAPTVTVNRLATRNTRPILTGTVSDTGGAGVSEVRVTVAGRVLKATINSGVWSVTLPVALANGTYNVQATATDLAGNARTDGTGGELKIDTRAPVVRVNRLTTRDNTPTLSGTVSDPMASATVAGSGIANVTVVVGGQTLTATVNGGRWSVAVPTALANGKYNVRATATDRAGNAATDTTAGELVVDAVAPVVTVNSRTVHNSRPTLSGTITDAAPGSGLASVRVIVGNQSFAARVQGTTWTAVVPQALANGTYDVRVVATDTAGNVGRDATTNELVVNVPAVRSGKPSSSAAVARAAAVIASQSGQASGTSAANDRDTQAQLVDLALASYPLA